MKRWMMCLGVMVVVNVLTGCAAWREYKSDYLGADEMDEHTLPDAGRTFKEDYLKGK